MKIMGNTIIGATSGELA